MNTSKLPPFSAALGGSLAISGLPVDLCGNIKPEH